MGGGSRAKDTYGSAMNMDKQIFLGGSTSITTGLCAKSAVVPRVYIAISITMKRNAANRTMFVLSAAGRR